MPSQALNPRLEFSESRIAQIETFRQHRDLRPQTLDDRNGIERSPEYRHQAMWCSTSDNSPSSSENALSETVMISMERLSAPPLASPPPFPQRQVHGAHGARSRSVACGRRG